MSRKIVKQVTTDEPFVRESGGSIDFSEDGRAVYRESFYLADPSLLETGILPQRGTTKHPDFKEAICSNVSCRRLEDGGWRIIVTYNNGDTAGVIDIGAVSDDGVLEVIGSLSTEPIETHPDFQTASIAGTSGSPANGAQYDSDGVFTGFAASSDFAGVDSYLVPTVLARHTYPDNSLPSGTLLGNIGTIQTPSHPDIVTPAGRTWLLSHVSYRRAGNSYEITEEFTLSGPGGWNTDIY